MFIISNDTNNDIKISMCSKRFRHSDDNRLSGGYENDCIDSFWEDEVPCEYTIAD